MALYEKQERRIGTAGEPIPYEEPYFEQETINELGHSFENCVSKPFRNVGNDFF